MLSIQISFNSVLLEPAEALFMAPALRVSTHSPPPASCAFKHSRRGRTTRVTLRKGPTSFPGCGVPGYLFQFQTPRSVPICAGLEPCGNYFSALVEISASVNIPEKWLESKTLHQPQVPLPALEDCGVGCSSREKF